MSTIDGGRHGRRDRARIRRLVGDHHLRAAGSVVVRSLFDGGMICEELQALVERHRMRVDTAEVAKPHSRRSHEIVHDADVGFGNNLEVEMQQVVVVFVHGPGETVFDRNHGGVRDALLQSPKDLLKPLERNYFGPPPEELTDGLLAEGSQFALKPDFYFFQRIPPGLARVLDINSLRISNPYFSREILF